MERGQGEGEGNVRGKSKAEGEKGLFGANAATNPTAKTKAR